MKRSTVLWIVALFLGWAFDFLFWKQAPGINFAVYVVLVLGGGLLALALNGIRLSWKALLLLVPILFFAAMSFIRLEGMSAFLSVALTLGLMGVLAVSALGGRWLWYSLADYVVNYARLIGSLFARPLIFLGENKKQAPAGTAPGPETENRKPGWKRFWAVLRGLLIALPIVAVFAALLSSADLVFAQRLGDFMQLFRLERLPEYLFRLFYILVFAYAIAGAILHAAQKSRDEKLVGMDKPLLPPFLGFTEAAVVLGAVVALFAVFVIIQFQYFFGGQTNIGVEGYTFAEYARRGFGELVAVAFFSLLLFLGLSGIVKRQGAVQRWVFSGLGIGMVTLVAVMLVSAFQRLLLYEAAYGFSRLRLYTHVFMIWLGVVLAVVVVLDILRRERFVALTMLLASIGFAATLMLVNVDGTIVRQNVDRAAAGQELDVAYLASLSDDSVPTLADLYGSASVPAGVRDAIGAALVCRIQSNGSRNDTDWRSFTLAGFWSEAALRSVQAGLKQYQLQADLSPMQVTTPLGKSYDCSNYYYGD